MRAVEQHHLFIGGKQPDGIQIQRCLAGRHSRVGILHKQPGAQTRQMPADLGLAGVHPHHLPGLVAAPVGAVALVLGHFVQPAQIGTRRQVGGLLGYPSGIQRAQKLPPLCVLGR